MVKTNNVASGSDICSNECLIPSLCSLHNVYDKVCSNSIVRNTNNNIAESFTAIPQRDGFSVSSHKVTTIPVNVYLHEGCGI
jgi:hypothetical protein